MGAIIISPKNKSEFKFIADLLKKLNIENRTISDEEQEDIFDILAANAIKDQECTDFEAFANSLGYSKKTLQTA